MLIITGIFNARTNKLTMNEPYILPTKPDFFTSSAGKVESVQKFKMKPFE